jgi:hypothetical protein
MRAAGVFELEQFVGDAIVFDFPLPQNVHNVQVTQKKFFFLQNLFVGQQHFRIVERHARTGCPWS